jgi:hypothetical protein
MRAETDPMAARRQPCFLTLLTALVPLVLGACSGPARAPQEATLNPPPGMARGAGDPLNAALLHASWALGAPGRLAGRPAEAARAAAELELLAANLPAEPRWIAMTPIVPVKIAEGRDEMRAAIGVPRDAPGQLVMDALWASAMAQEQGNQAAAAELLPARAFPAGGAQTMTRLANLPPLPSATFGLSRAQQEMNRLMQDVDVD